MKENRQQEFTQVLQRLQCQFLCCYPLHSIQWELIPRDINWLEQNELIEATYRHPLNEKYPLKIAYQLNFLKGLIKELEKISEEVHDTVYESFCDVQQRVAHDLAEKYAYKHYVLPQENADFTLRESKSFVAEGTTGLCSWQASLALADYLLHHREILRGRNVMELGSGTGLCGFILQKCCTVKRLLLTDGSVECVHLMRENFKRNFPESTEDVAKEGLFALEGSGEVQIDQLSWDEIEATQLVAKTQPDILLAADVVYDDSVFDDLSHAVDFVFSTMGNATKMLLAATVRNEHTLRKFLDKLNHLNFSIKDEQLASPHDSFLHWDRSTPIRILQVTRSQEQ